MQVVLIEQYGGPKTFQLAEVPRLVPSDGMVRVRVEAAAVNPADVKWRAGLFHDIVPMHFPHVL